VANPANLRHIYHPLPLPFPSVCRPLSLPPVFKRACRESRRQHNNKRESMQTRPSSSSLFLPCVRALVLRSRKPRVAAACRTCGLGLHSRKTASRSSLPPTAPRPTGRLVLLLAVSEGPM
jgi:hypothetical protein